MNDQETVARICEEWGKEIGTDLADLQDEISEPFNPGDENVVQKLFGRAETMRRVALKMETVAILMSVVQINPTCPRCGFNQTTNSYDTNADGSVKRKYTHKD